MRSLIPALVVLSLCFLGCSFVLAQGQPKPDSQHVFTEEDGVRMLRQMKDTLENNNQDRFLQTFDSEKMPEYAEFRERVLEMFEKYSGFQAGYHLRQVSMAESGNGVLLADFDLAANPAGGGPVLRRSGTLRLVAAWNGKDWRIVEVNPRAMFGG
jgi:hypothetical protein